MIKFRVAVINKILNFRRYAEVIAHDKTEAMHKAVKLYYGYSEVESCIPVEIAV